MDSYYISEKNFAAFIAQLISEISVIAPVSYQQGFSFQKLKHFDELRLDYDVSILPPKKVFFPPQQVIVKFDGNKFSGTVNPLKQILFGVHPYDLIALDQLDFLFSENYEDINYTAYRKATTIVGSNIQRVASRAFWDSVNKNVKPKGQDAFLTYVKEEQGYVLEIFTEKGEELLQSGCFQTASQTLVDKADAVSKQLSCPEKINSDSDKAVEQIHQSFDNIELWNQLAEKCFSCGSCNTLCPTCYCFNIEDKWHTDQQSGERIRYWDSCMTEEFAQISLGQGNYENFRSSTAERMRHRIMRKFVYLNDKLGTQACVGCGRCSIACTADIADPVVIINKIMEAADG